MVHMTAFLLPTCSLPSDFSFSLTPVSTMPLKQGLSGVRILSISRKGLKRNAVRLMQQFYADWIDRLLRKQRGEKVHIDLKQALPDGVLLADLIFTLNFVLFKSKAITDVLDSLFRIQWNSSNKADFMPGLPKEGKRASGLQPPSAAMVSNRRFINPKAGSSSPLPVRCSTTGKMYKQRSEADHNAVMQSNRIPSHAPHSCPTDQNKYGYHYPSETHTIGTSGIIRPGLISGTKSNFVDLSALSRRASSVSYRSSISSSQSEATSNCSTPTGVGGVDEAQSPAVPRSSFSLRYDVQQSPATPVPCTGPPKEPSWPNQPIQMIRQDQYSRPEAPQEWSQPASSCYQSSGPSHPPNEFHSQPVMMVRPKVSYRDHRNVRDAGQLGFSGKSLQFRLPFYGDADERRRLKAFNKKRQKSTDVEKTESRAEGSSGNVSSSTGSSRTHQAFGKSDGTCLANDPPDSHTQEPIDAIQANRIIGKSNFRDPVTNQFSSNAKNDLYYPTAHAHFQPIPLHPFPPQHSVNGRGSEPPPSSHVNCPALSWVQNTQRRVSIVAAPTQYDAPKETRSHRSGAGLSRDLLPTTVQSAIRNTPSDASNTFVNLSPYLQNEHPQTTPPDGSNTTPHIYYGRTALNLSKMTAPADLNLLRLPAKRISLDEISSIALSATEPVQPVLRKPASPQKTPSLPSSNSASSSLSAGEDKNFCDSGISSSSYSKDSACTSPSENPSNKGALSIGVCLNSSLSSQNESSGASEKSVPLTVSDSSVSLEQWDNCRAKSVEPSSNCSDRIRSVLSSSKLQRPTTGVKPPHSSVPKMLEPMVSRDSECAKILSRQRAKELYSVVKNRENHKLITASPKLRASSVCSKMNTCETSLSLPGQSRPVRPQSLRKPSSELIAVTSNSNQLIFSPCTSEPNNIYITEDVGQQLCMPDRDVNDNHGQGQINTQEDHAHVSQLSAVNGNKTGDQPPLDKTDATYSVCPTGLPPVNRTTMYPAQNCRQPGSTHEDFCLNSHAVTSVADITHFQLVQTEPNKSSEAKLEKTPTSGIESDYRSLDHVKDGTSSPEFIYKDPSTLSLSDSKSNLYAPFSDFALLTKGSKSETAGFTDAGGNMMDPDQLLSSLSKLNLDAGANGPLWDKTCFSDVESEYAALELLLPLPKIPTDPQERLPPKSSFDECSSQSFFEPGYYSDTEAAFTNQQAPRPSTVLGSFIDRRQGGSVFGSPSTNARLPIASVAPIMAETKQTRASNSSIYAHSNLSAPSSHGQQRDSFAKFKHPNSEADTGSEPPLGLDSLHCLEDTKWPRLRSAQSVSHSLSTERANSVTSVSGPYAHKPNVLENVKLPYPMGPLNLNHGVCSQSLQVVRPSISNYALHRKNSCSAGFSVPDTAAKETGCLGGMDTPPGFLSCGERMFGKVC
ncbi:unnamed protein product [Calicophoron daubneyi]|uniref:Uncharacterized protein n=1 Tax=Calicophoron daubneyi TaxID=300641 RepID=A0AAV2TFV6_CALDB